ncbi:zinc finger CCCH domain-containing protein 44-like isoform X2 [Pyrus communis]|uniref:zinc finger CCCH domain-containing protein 44-like isoform X2 n=1 Tax=Pyrus communis TaxID=23211 RepID=UPI0035BFE59B
MELEHAQLASAFYGPSIQEGGGGGGEPPQSQEVFDRSMPAAEDCMAADQCETIGGGMVVGKAGQMVVVKEEAGKNLGKRRRGRPPSGHAKATAVRKMQDEEEDVCFICFDGGSLVLCDRRGCPKAYHPSCIKRDEAFFKSKAKWNCGWHICSSCQKAAHYWCYTCTYSLCKRCTKGADYQCVRGNKGFCGTCMRTIMLIENVQENKEGAQVDFDDKSSWEYLFKVYWILLKGKLSLTLDDLFKAKNPWNEAAVMVDLEATHSKRSNKKPRTLDKDLSVEDTVWASKELLEFVAHLRNGDTSVLSQYDVQALLVEYIKKNNLRDPRQKCQIICDSRLINLFGKECVGHFEMLKLLEFHFLIKESSKADNIISAGVVNTVGSQMEIDGNYDNQMMMGNDKRRKTRKRVDEKGPPTNPDAFAAIDLHNINLIYLRRNCVENLIEDVDKLHEKVVGSIVRIRIPSGDQKEDIYRLVQVTGTSKVAQPYKVGTKTTDVKLEILNLNKKEVISIDEISNQEFSQDECKRLRQSIKCRLSKQLTVGEIQEKAMALHAVRVNDCLEAEVLRISQLRDRASEKGRRKELRQCVDKLQLLNSPEEHLRRLREIPEVRSDPSMDPSCESEGSAGAFDKKQDAKVRPRRSSRKGRTAFSQPREGDTSSNSRSKAQKNPGRATFGINGCNTTRSQVNLTGLVAFDGNNQSAVESNTLSEVASENSSLPSSIVTSANHSVDDFETDIIWHYQDPTGKVQGPFALMQLRKWNTAGHFPLDHRIWKIDENPDDSILLADALNGQYKEPLLPHDSPLLSQGFTAASDDRNNGQDDGRNKSMNTTPVDVKQVEESWNMKQDGQNLQNSGNSELLRSTAPADVVNSSDEQTGNVLQGRDPLKDNNSSPNQPQESSSQPSPAFPVKPSETLSHQEGESRGEEINSEQKNGNLDPQQAAQAQITNGQRNESRSDSEGHSGQSSGQNWRPPPVSSPSNGRHSNSDLVPLIKSLEIPEQDQKEHNFSDMPCPTPKPSNGDLQGQAAENRQSVPSNVPVQDAGHSWSTSSSLVGGGAPLPEVGGDWAKPSSIEEWESSLYSASSFKPSEMNQFTEPTEFCTLPDESVSDLLAEVEAMETLSSLATPTSIMNCRGDFTEGSKNDSFSSVDGFSPAPDPGKGDALSSTGDLRASMATDEPLGVCQGNALDLSSTLQVSMVTDEPVGACQGNALDLKNRSGVHSSTSPEMEGDRKYSDVSVNQFEAGTEMRTTAPSDMDNHWNNRSETTGRSWEAVQPVPINANMGRGGPDHRSVNLGWGGGQGIPHGNTSLHPGHQLPAGRMWESQPRYGGERLLGPRDRGFQSRDLGMVRGRFGWNRQTMHGNGNGSSLRPPPKGQRVCKYYESGHCKKGASCDYLHP